MMRMRVFSFGAAALSQVGTARAPSAPTVAALARVRKLRRFMGQPAQPERRWFGFIFDFWQSGWFQGLLVRRELPEPAVNPTEDRPFGAARRLKDSLRVRLTKSSIACMGAASSFRKASLPRPGYCNLRRGRHHLERQRGSGMKSPLDRL